MAGKKGDYKVGYRKPPVSTRWKKGQSGNPKGAARKKLPTSYAELVDAAMQKKISVMMNGRKSKMSHVEALAINLRNRALQGDLKALKALETLRGWGDPCQCARRWPDQVHPQVGGRRAARTSEGDRGRAETAEAKRGRRER